MVRSAVQVVVRTRPTDRFATGCIKLEDDGKSLQLHLKKNKKKDDFVNNQQENFNFKFDAVHHNISQEAIYDQIGQPIVRSVLDGYNGTAMAYGQTGAGKTYTMGGGQDFKQRGLIPRALGQVFNDTSAKPEQSFDIRVSYMEIYNERIYDLLSSLPEANAPELAIQEDSKGGISVKGLTTVTVKSEQEALGLFFEGNDNRAIAQHQLNMNSSRSHCIFTIYISSQSRVESEGNTIHSKLNFVDLAGSERLSKTGSDGAIAKEAMYINKSLTFLEQVVIALSTASRDHVPYRQSKLTNILKDSLGGNCKTTMCANIWGEEAHLEETTSTLKFATRMMRVQNEVRQNITSDPEATIRKMAKEISELKSELQMQNQLHGKSHITYSEDFTDDERYELQKQVRAYVEGKTQEVEVKSLRSVKEMFKIFKLFIEQAETEAAKNIKNETMDATGTLKGTKPGTPGTATEDGVGDVDGTSGIGIGIAIPAKLDKQTRDQTRANQVPASRESATAAQGAFPEPEVQVEMPDRNQAFEMYKQNEGAELADVLKRAQGTLRDSKKLMKDAAAKVNASKGKIDDLRMKVEAMKREQENHDDDEDVVDVEYFRFLTALKEEKSNYRLLYEELQSSKQEVDYETRLVEQSRQRLIVDFTQWYDSQYGEGISGGAAPSLQTPKGRSTKKGPAKGAAGDDDPLDEGERFDNMEMQRIMDEDPESTAYYSAKKAATGRQGAATKKMAATARKR